MWEAWRIAVTGRTSLFFDDSVASERVKSDYESILKTKLSDFQVLLKYVLGTRVPLEMFGVLLSNTASRQTGT